MEDTITQQKPNKPKPHFYAVCFPSMQQIAKDLGYNLVIHGSMNRDLDLVAIPWIDNPKSHYDLITSLDEKINGNIQYDDIDTFERGYFFSILPGGRSSYVINIYRGGYYYGRSDSGERLYTPDPQYYVDISITPLPQK
jgi:hypothetical protein